MKKLFFYFLGMTALVACQPKTFKIEGKLTGVENGKVYLQNIREGRPNPVDTADVVAGAFTFEGKVDAPELYFIIVEGQQMPVVLFAENGKIKIEGSVDSLDKATISGSKSHDLFKKFNDEMPDSKRSMAIRDEYMQAQMSQDQAKMTALGEEMNAIIENQQAYMKKFVFDNVANPVGAFMGLNVASMLEYAELDSLVTLLEAQQPTHIYVQDLKKAIEPMKAHQLALEAVKEGKPAPAFSLVATDGKEVSLESFKGKYVLVDFWASWCQPCRQENPNVVNAYKAYNSKGFEVFSVSLDRHDQARLNAVKEDGLTWAQVRDTENKVAELYAIQQIPTTFLLDREGVIIATNLRGEALEAKLKELMP